MRGNLPQSAGGYGSTPTFPPNIRPDVLRLKDVRTSLLFALHHCTPNERPLFVKIRDALEMIDARLLVLSEARPDPATPLPWETAADVRG